MCLVETDKTLKEVWSKDKKCLRSDLDTFLISIRSFSSFLGLLDQELKPVVVLPLKNILRKLIIILIENNESKPLLISLRGLILIPLVPMKPKLKLKVFL